MHCAALWWALRSASYSVLWEGLDLDFGSRGRGERKGSPQSDFPTIHMHVCVCICICVYITCMCALHVLCVCVFLHLCPCMHVCVYIVCMCVWCMY